MYETITLPTPLLFYAQAELHVAEIEAGRTFFTAHDLPSGSQLHHSYTVHWPVKQETDEYELPLVVRSISVTPEGRINAIWWSQFILPAQPAPFPSSPGISGRWKGTIQANDALPEASHPSSLTLLLRQEGQNLRGNIVFGTYEHLLGSEQAEPGHYVFKTGKGGLD